MTMFQNSNRRLSRLGVSSLCMAAAMAIGTSASAADWYVDASAAPGGDGSAANPFQTIAEASGALAGDTVYVAAGSYSGNALSFTGVNLIGAGSGVTTFNSQTTGSGGSIMTVGVQSGIDQVVQGISFTRDPIFVPVYGGLGFNIGGGDGTSSLTFSDVNIDGFSFNSADDSRLFNLNGLTASSLNFDNVDITNTTGMHNLFKVRGGTGTLDVNITGGTWSNNEFLTGFANANNSYISNLTIDGLTYEDNDTGFAAWATDADNVSILNSVFANNGSGAQLDLATLDAGAVLEIINSTFEGGSAGVQWAGDPTNPGTINTSSFTDSTTGIVGGGASPIFDEMASNSFTGTSTDYSGIVLVEVPEPGSLALLAIGGALVLHRRRQHA